MWILFFKPMSFLAKILPRRVAFFITDRLADGAYFIAFKKGRIAALNNLRFALRHLKTENEIRFMVLEQFRNFARFIYEFLQLLHMSQKQLKETYELVGFDKFVEAFKQGNGTIVVTGHLGNWELGVSAVAQQNIPVTAVVMPHSTDDVTAFFDRTRLSRGVGVVPVDKAVRVGLGVLRANGCLAIVADRDFTGTGMPVDFLGRKTIFPVGPARLAAKTGAPICPAFAIRLKNGKYKVYFEEPYRVGKLADGSPDIQDALRRWAWTLGKYVTMFPTQWYLFEPAWPTK
jgi:KDO2-lipid IV(A) lauroyltransferase